MLCAIFGSLLQSRFIVPVYMAIGLLQVQSLTNTDFGTHWQQQQQHVAAIQSAAPSYMVIFANAPVTPTDVKERLKVNAIPQSKLIAVSFTDTNPVISASVANMVMNTYLVTTPGVTVASSAVRPTQPQRTIFYRLTGAAAGALLGLTLLAVRRRAQNAQRVI